MTLRIAYLCSRDTLPGPARRGDAFEHDRSVDALSPAFARHGLQLVPCAWDAPLPPDTAAALLGTTWDYWERLDTFLDTVDTLPVPLFNPPPMVRWNAHKRYLQQLADLGVPSVPTVWLDHPCAEGIREAFATLGCDELVVKRQVGAGAYEQHRLHRRDDLPALDAPMLAQPFLPSIHRYGEVSLVYVDGDLSHGLRKRPASGDYRIQSLYGGRQAPHQATTAERQVARHALHAVQERFGSPLYARVDLVEHLGIPRLIELELVEPYLYPEEGAELGPRLAGALRTRLALR